MGGVTTFAMTVSQGCTRTTSHIRNSQTHRFRTNQAKPASAPVTDPQAPLT